MSNRSRVRLNDNVWHVWHFRLEKVCPNLPESNEEVTVIAQSLESHNKKCSKWIISNRVWWLSLGELTVRNVLWPFKSLNMNSVTHSNSPDSPLDSLVQRKTKVWAAWTCHVQTVQNVPEKTFWRASIVFISSYLIAFCERCNINPQR